MNAASAAKYVLSTFQLVMSPTQRALPEARNSLWYAILDQLSYTELCNELLFDPMSVHEKATSLRKNMTYNLKRYIRSGAIKLDKSSVLTIDGWLKQMER